MAFRYPFSAGCIPAGGGGEGDSCPMPGGGGDPDKMFYPNGVGASCDGCTITGENPAPGFFGDSAVLPTGGSGCYAPGDWGPRIIFPDVAYPSI
jgi:hypothetical protein